jgi:hypothetical protein
VLDNGGIGNDTWHKRLMEGDGDGEGIKGLRVKGEKRRK